MTARGMTGSECERSDAACSQRRICSLPSSRRLPRSAGSAQAAPRFKAVAFDYFVIFNANSVVPAVEKAFPGKGTEFTKAWRAKQFEYGFLRSITGRHADFFKVTEDALVYTAEAMKLELTPGSGRACSTPT